MGEWSELPADLLTLIDKDLDLYPDKLRFRCICTHWQSTSPVELPDLRQPQPPWLLLPYESGSFCGLYHPFKNKVYEVDLSEIGEKVFVGSCYGWVVTVQLDGSIDIVNPLTRVRIPLPPRATFADVIEYRPDKVGEEYLVENENLNGGDPYTLDSMSIRNHMITKIALSCSPSSGDFIAVALYRSVRLAYCKLGDEKWSDLVEFDKATRKYKDITFRGGKLYAFSNAEELMVCDDIASCPKLRKCVTIHVDGCDHLVNSSHRLMVV